MTGVCFAEYESKSGRKRCRVLNLSRCIGCKNCKSFKTLEDIKEEEIRNKKRLQSLPKDQQQHIINKYHIKIWD